MEAQNFLDHLVFEKLEQLSLILNDEDVKINLDVSDQNFLETFFQYCTHRLKLTLPVLIQESDLNALATELEAGIVQINSFLGNKNIGHLSNAKNNFFSALSRVKNLPYPITKKDFDFAKTIGVF